MGVNLEADKRKNGYCWDSLFTNNTLNLEKLENNLNVHKSWKEFLATNIEILQEVIDEIRTEDCAPLEPEKILRFLQQDLSKINVIILGQDPYPYLNFATGRAFEVGNISTWKGLADTSLKRKGTSLQKIVICIYRNVTGDKNIDNYSEVLKKIEDKTFKISPPKPWFDSLEEQGVLFLNTSFTCKLGGKANSHKNIWNKKNNGFTQKLLNFINQKNPTIQWFTWGNAAKKLVDKKVLGIDKALIFRSYHPAATSIHINNEDHFLNFKGFSQVTEIDWFGREI